MVARRRTVTLTADIGAAYAAQMKAVLVREAPGATLVDLALDLAPFDRDEAAFLLEPMCQGFPRGTVHVVVVDPGVGGARAPVAFETPDGQLYVGPHNGVFDRIIGVHGVAEAVRLPRRARGSPPRVGATFDGRDLFAPAAARLANGVPLARLGRPVRLPIRETGLVRLGDRSASGRIVHRDRFGNAITNLPSAWLARTRPGTRIAYRRPPGRWQPATVARVYEDLPVGRTGILPSSFGTLELARREAPFLPAAPDRRSRRIDLRRSRATGTERPGRPRSGGTTPRSGRGRRRRRRARPQRK